jgi:biopolymer transport protein ExbD
MVENKQMKTVRPSAEVSTISMADIAFLLLTFFLVTTVIDEQRGIPMLLPQWVTEKPVPQHTRNIFSIQINSSNRYLIEGEAKENLVGIRERIKKFILNNNASPKLSESPTKAIVSLKADRGTTYESFIAALDEVHAAYLEIYASRANMSVKEFRNLDLKFPQRKALHDKAKEGIPMNISIAEPSKVEN